MESEAFIKLKRILTSFISEADATKVMERQLLRAGVSADRFTYTHIAELISSITASASLYSTDDEKIPQMNKALTQLINTHVRK